MTELDGPLPAGPMPLCGNPMATPPASGIDVALRQQLSNLQGLLGISMMMTERGDEQDILDLATTAVPSLGRCRIEGVYLFDLGWRSTAGAGKRHEVRADVQAQLTALRGDGGMIAIRGLCWSWAFQLRSSEGQFGYLVVSAGEQPPDAELFLLRVLAQQTGIALANARLHARERASAEQLRAANCKLAGTVEALERKTAIHDRLTRAAVVLEGPDGIAAAVHELTGFPVAVEDGHGNLLAWAGPGQPAPLGRTAPGRRERVLAKALREGRPIRSHGRLLAVVQPRPDVVGVLALIDPDTRASEAEQVALEHGATVLAMELARLHSLAETELRLGHDTVAEVLDGTNPEAALARARALGYDLDRPHRVGLVDAHGARIVDDSFFDLVRRAASATALGTLLLPRDGAVVVLSVTEPVDDSAPWERFRAVIENGLGDRCRVGVSGICNSVTEFPRAYREAQLALRLHDMTGEIDHAVVYDQLGVYQLLAEVQDVTAVERHAKQWIGALLDYDARRTSDLVPTLSRFLECGGNYDATARSLQIGRSTLRYRLRRIREISGHDHADPDTRFNLQLATRGWRTRHALENVSAESAVLPGRAWTPEP